MYSPVSNYLLWGGFVGGFENSLKNIGNNIEDLVKDGGSVADILSKNIGIFLDCKEILGQQVEDISIIRVFLPQISQA